MGTNFYWNVDMIKAVILPTGREYMPEVSNDDPELHIGKRSAAGGYCWNCEQTLCPGGESAIHSDDDGPWPTECPKCGRSDGDGHSSANVELGFQEPATVQPTGVATASSFLWAQEPEVVRRVCSEQAHKEIIVTEYGRKMSGEEFLTMLICNCPIEFTDSIGQRFS